MHDRNVGAIRRHVTISERDRMFLLDQREIPGRVVPSIADMIVSF
jgi:hypothetical protein